MALDTKKYKEVFLNKAKKHLTTMNNRLLKLEKSPTNQALMNDIFRAAHTLKSVAAMMNYKKTAVLCHALEDTLDAIKKKRIKLENCADILFKCFDNLDSTLKEISKDGQELDTTVLTEQLRKLSKRGKKQVLEKSEVPEVSVDTSTDTESAIEKLSSINVKTEILDRLMNLSEELLIGKMRLDRINEAVDMPELSAAVDNLSRSISDLQYNVMQSRMVPLAYIFDRFPRMVRDIAKQQQKEVDIEIQGADIELDRTVVDEIGECLVHLLRNAIDHGIETPAERRKNAKPSKGNIKIIAVSTKDYSTIEVVDDGAGLDLAQIRNIAAKRGVLSSGATQEEAIDAIFFGVSTTKQVTAVSGRGFGLNIVKKRIESLGGNVRVSSEPKKGTKFIVEIPLTLAIIDALFVEVAGTVYAIPVANVERLITVDKKNIKGMIDYEAIILNEIEIPITRLDLLFNPFKAPSSLDKQPIVIAKKAGERIGLAVDNLMETQEIVIKPLHVLARKSKYLSGSTIVGSGEVVSILDVANLILTRRQYSKTGR